jgi:hypothetical protein
MHRVGVRLLGGIHHGHWLDDLLEEMCADLHDIPERLIDDIEHYLVTADICAACIAQHQQHNAISNCHPHIYVKLKLSVLISFSDSLFLLVKVERYFFCAGYHVSGGKKFNEVLFGSNLRVELLTFGNTAVLIFSYRLYLFASPHQEVVLKWKRKLYCSGRFDI